MRLVTDADVAEKIAYVAANPVKGGLVKHPDQWPGVIAWAAKKLNVTRPRSYFAEDGTCPPELTLVVSEPPRLGVTEDDEVPWRTRIAQALAARIEDAHCEMRAEGREFLGREAALATSFAKRASTYEEKRGVIPTFAARMWEVRARLRKAEKLFRARYRAALERWREGAALVTFPFGTWAMRGVRGVVIEDAPLQAA